MVSARTRMVRGARPGCFAAVMATGIVSVALRLPGNALLSAALLAIAVATFAVLVVLSGWRAAAFPADLRADLNCPGRAFSYFAVIAACDVLAARLADDGYRGATAALSVAALAGWLGLTCLIPGRLVARPRRVAIADISGSWYLWVVATQSLVIAATSLRSPGPLPARTLALAAGAAWWAGVLLYLVITAAVASRLLLAPPGPQAATAPYWVAMGAASITVLAAVQLLHGPGALPAGVTRAALVRVTVAFWVAATGLIPPLAVRSCWRHLRGHARLRFRADLWMIVFPAGMYATASVQLGAAAGFPVVRDVGMGIVWLAVSAWMLTVVLMLLTLFPGVAVQGWTLDRPGPPDDG